MRPPDEFSQAGFQQEVISDLEAIAERATASLGELSHSQLNWKPAAKRWSIGQCLDHLVTTHSLYYPLFRSLAEGPPRPSFLERRSPFTGWWGRFLIRMMHPDNTKKVKTTAKAEPSSSEIEAGIVERFAEHQAELVEHFRALPEGLDPATTVLTSPLLGIVTYSLGDCMRILVVHGQRHIRQAEAVKEMPEFPR